MSANAEQVPGIQRRRFGEIVVTALNDGHIMLPCEAINDISAQEMEDLYRAYGRRPPFATAINAYLIQTPEVNVLVDGGCGRYMGPTLGRLPKNLAAAGLSPKDIDVVVVSHMHPDHIGGLLCDDDSARYPRAKVFLAADELRYWTNASHRASSPSSTLDSFDIAAKLTESYAGRIEAFDGAPEILPGIKALPLNGHTPGHTGFVVGEHDRALLIWGDVMHAPELQLKRPDLTVIFDVDPVQARETRRGILERAVIEDFMIAGMHIPFPGFIRISRSENHYRAYPQVFQYDLIE